MNFYKNIILFELINKILDLIKENKYLYYNSDQN